MHERRFDELGRALASGKLTRRQGLKAAAAVLVASFFSGRLKPDAAGAQTALCDPACRPHETCCNGGCVDTSSNLAHCGTCNHQCWGSCVDGTCDCTSFGGLRCDYALADGRNGTLCCQTWHCCRFPEVVCRFPDEQEEEGTVCRCGRDASWCVNKCCGPGQTCRRVGNTGLCECPEGSGEFCVDKCCATNERCDPETKACVPCPQGEDPCGDKCCAPPKVCEFSGTGNCVCPDSSLPCGDNCCAGALVCLDPATGTCGCEEGYEACGTACCPEGQCQDPATGTCRCGDGEEPCGERCCPTGQCQDPATGTCECPDGQRKCGRSCCDRSRTCCGEGDNAVCCASGASCCQITAAGNRPVCCPAGSVCVTDRRPGLNYPVVCCPAQRACRGQCCPSGQVCIGELACCPSARATADRRGCCDPGFTACGNGCCPTSIFGGYVCRNGRCMCAPGQECGTLCCHWGMACKNGRCQPRLIPGPPLR